MKQASPFLATFFTPPAVILNIGALIGQNVNAILVAAISVSTIVFWVVSIKNKKLEKKKLELEIEREQMEIQRLRNAEQK
jgi:putative effector of murein hydrolase LrgA (UPF0299 family)